MDRNDEENNQRIMAIDYLKGIAVILVILTHALSKNQRLKIAGPFWISMAVPIFMTLSGFTNTLSANKNKITSFKQYFRKEQFVPKLVRIVWPYSLIILFELGVGLVKKNLLQTGPFVDFAVVDYIVYILTGGTTPGSYYVLILIQFLFLFPLILFAYKKSPKKSLVLFFTIHFLFDLTANCWPIPGKIYRVLIFRYLAFIIMGIALYYSYPTLKKIWKKLALISWVYIGMYAYVGYVPKVFSKWTNTALPTVFWALALVILGMKYLEIENNNVFRYWFSRIGQASYQIFLMQKFLFGFGLNQLLREMNLIIGFRIIIAIILCCFLGILLQVFVFQTNQNKEERDEITKGYKR